MRWVLVLFRTCARDMCPRVLLVLHDPSAAKGQVGFPSAARSSRLARRAFQEGPVAERSLRVLLALCEQMHLEKAWPCAQDGKNLSREGFLALRATSRMGNMGRCGATACGTLRKARNMSGLQSVTWGFVAAALRKASKTRSEGAACMSFSPCARSLQQKAWWRLRGCSYYSSCARWERARREILRAVCTQGEKIVSRASHRHAPPCIRREKCATPGQAVRVALCKPRRTRGRRSPALRCLAQDEKSAQRAVC